MHPPPIRWRRAGYLPLYQRNGDTPKLDDHLLVEVQDVVEVSAILPATRFAPPAYELRNRLS